MVPAAARLDNSQTQKSEAGTVSPLAKAPGSAAVWSEAPGHGESKLPTISHPEAISASNSSEGEQARAAERFQRIIDPITNPVRYPDLHERFPRRSDLVQHIALENGLSPRSVWRSLQSFEEQGMEGLARKIRSDKGETRVWNEAAEDFVHAGILPKKGVYGELSIKDLTRAYEEERLWRLARAGRPLSPSDRKEYARYLGPDGMLALTAQLPRLPYSTIRDYVEKKIPEVAKTLARKGEEAFHNSQEILSFRDLASIQPLDYVVLDHRRIDAFCIAPERGGWKLIRPWVSVAIDMRTRKWLAWAIVETPSSDCIATVLRRVFIDHGLPRAIYADHGKDYVCEWFEGKAKRSRRTGRIGEIDGVWRGVLGTLGVRVVHAIVRRARSKIVEANFLSLSHFDRTLPEYVGNKPTARPERFQQMLDQHEAWVRKERLDTPFRTIQQFAALYSDEIEDLNEREHSGEGMQKVTPTGRGWMCPNEAWSLLIRRVERRTVPEGVLSFCFAKRREIKVQHGEIRVTFDGRAYHYRIAGNPVQLMALNGRTVEFGYDPLDLSEGAVYHEKRFIGLANCVALRKMGETEFVDDERVRRSARRQVKRFIDAIHQTVPFADPETRLARRRAVLPVRAAVSRPEVAASIPEAITDAHAAREAAAAFHHEADLPFVPVIHREERSEDDEFRFFD